MRHSVSQAVELFLPDEVDVRHFRNTANLLKKRKLPVLLETFFDFLGAVEMLFEGTFSLSNNHEDIGNSTFYTFLYDILNRWRVDHRKHFLWDGLCRGEEPGAETSGRDDGFRDRHGSRVESVESSWTTCSNIGKRHERRGKEEL